MYRHCTDVEWRTPPVSKPLAICLSVSPSVCQSIDRTPSVLNLLWTTQHLWATYSPPTHCPSPYIQTKSLLFQLMPTVSRPPTVHHCEEPGFILNGGGRPCRYQGLLFRSHWNCLFSRLSRPSSLSISSQGKCFSSDNTGPLLKFPQFIDVFLVSGHPKMDTVFWMWSAKCWVEGASLPSICWLCSCSCSPGSCWPSLLPLDRKGRENSPDCSHLN